MVQYDFLQELNHSRVPHEVQYVQLPVELVLGYLKTPTALHVSAVPTCFILTGIVASHAAATASCEQGCQHKRAVVLAEVFALLELAPQL